MGCSSAFWALVAALLLYYALHCRWDATTAFATLFAGIIAALVILWQIDLVKQQIAFSTYLDLDKEWNSEKMIKVRKAVHAPGSTEWDHSRLEGALEFFEKFALLFILWGDNSSRFMKPPSAGMPPGIFSSPASMARFNIFVTCGKILSTETSKICMLITSRTKQAPVKEPRKTGRLSASPLKKNSGNKREKIELKHWTERLFCPRRPEDASGVEVNSEFQVAILKRGMLAYQTAVAELYQLGHELHQTASYKFDLKHMRVLCEALGSPQTKFPSVLIAGTNGKGSTAATLASILRTAGYRTGLYTSPHLVRINERIRSMATPSATPTSPPPMSAYTLWRRNWSQTGVCRGIPAFLRR